MIAITQCAKNTIILRFDQLLSTIYIIFQHYYNFFVKFIQIWK